MGDARLVLIRHAKTADGPYDIERPLTPRGERDALAIATILTDLELDVDRAVVSPATRARQTWDATRVAAGELLVDERIYDNDVESLLAIIRETPDEVRTLVLVGHNPSFAELAVELDDGAGDETAREALHDGYPTGGVAVFGPSGSWAEVGPRSAALSAFAVGRGPE